MNIAGVLLSSVLFIFTAFLFPTLNDACAAATGDIAALIQSFPIILLVIESILPVYFALGGKKK